MDAIRDGLHYGAWGSGPALLLLHPPGWDRRIWDLCIPHLSDDYRCIAPDQRGWGRSEWSPEKIDLLADARNVLGDATVGPPVWVVSDGSAADLALGLTLSGDPVVGGLMLFNPSLREYLDPRLPSYLGQVVSEQRSDVLSTIGGRAIGDPSVDGLRRATKSLIDETDDGSADRDRARHLLDAMMETGFARGKQPQATQPIRVVDRLDEVAVPVLIVTTGENPAKLATARELVRGLGTANLASSVSEWEAPFPLAQPRQAAQLIRQHFDSASETGLPHA